MKAFLIILLLLIPLAYAQEDVLSARKASLDLNVNEFILQMNAVIGFSSNKSINTKDLTEIKSSFEAKLTEAMQVKTLGELKSKEKEMKDLSKQFKDKTKEEFKGKISDLRIELFKIKQKNKDKFKDKKDRLNNERKKLIGAAHDRRISEITARIESDKIAGKESRIQKLLLESFQKSKSRLNETEFVSSGLQLGNFGDIRAKTMSVIKNIFASLMNKTRMSDIK